MTDVPTVIVETNWIIDVALGHDHASVELLGHTQAGRVHLFLPTFCVAEATKTVESKQGELSRMRAEILPRLGRELSRSPVTRQAGVHVDDAIEALAAAHDAMASAFWSRLRDIVESVTLLPPEPATVDLTAAIYNALTLSPADSSVLASAIVACRRGLCRTFMSRDGDFAQDPVREHMMGEGLTFLDSAHPIVGPLRA